ncbi:hypothetical protein Dimus_001233 [Dionaea muscipula]
MRSSEDCSFMLILVKEFYAKIKVTHLRKKDVIKSSVKGIDIEFDHERLATILGVHVRNGMREYIERRRVKSGEMKPFRRFIHFLVMKNVIQRFRRETLEASWIDIYRSSNDKEVSRYATSDDETHELCDLMKDHELPYGDWLTLVFEAFGVP